MKVVYLNEMYKSFIIRKNLLNYESSFYKDGFQFRVK